MKAHVLPWYSFLFCIAIATVGCPQEMGFVCERQTDCTQPGKPICALTFCRGCDQDLDCQDNWKQRQQEAMSAMMSLAGPPTLVCEASTGSCRECMQNSQCQAARPTEPLLRVCKPETRSCVGCVQDSDCAANTDAAKDGLLTCLVGENRCIDCMNPSDCAARPGMPYCASNRCSACADDSHCQGASGKPYCETPAGAARKQCVNCTGLPPGFCASRSVATPFCAATGQCAPCSRHEDCAGVSGICHRPGDYAPPAAVGVLMTGQCVPKEFVKDVTPATLGAELGSPTGAPYLRLLDGSYADLTVGRDVVLVGTRDLLQNINHRDSMEARAVKAVISSISITAGRVLLYDLRIERPSSVAAKAAIKCSGGRALLRQSRLINDTFEYGLDASTGCQEVRVGQSFVRSKWQAMMLKAPSLSYHVTNTLIARSGIDGGPPFHSSAAEIGPTATGTFAFNTLYMNTRGITCDSGQAIANSAIVGDVSSSSTVGCTEQSLHKNISSTGPSDYVETPVGSDVYQSSSGVQANLKGRAMQALNPAVSIDLFGSPRPRPAGAPYADIGCEEFP